MSSFEKKIRDGFVRSEIGQNSHVICDLLRWGQRNVCSNEDNSATLTPFGSLIRIRPAKVVSGNRSWTAKLRAMLAWLVH